VPSLPSPGGAEAMKSFQVSLRTKVILSLTFLMASAMLLVGMVMLKVSQHDLIQGKVDQGRLLKGSLERLINTSFSGGGGSLQMMQRSLAGLQGENSEIERRWRITVIDRDGLSVYSTEAGDGKKSGDGQRLPGLERVMRLGGETIFFTPVRTVFSWSLPEKMVLDAPLFRKAKVIGAVRLETGLDDVRLSLRRSYKLFLFYIILDILVLVLFGTYVFSKVVVRPVQKLVETAERFQEGDRLPELSKDEANELGKLAQALNAMLQRLAKNKEELRQHIVSLEQANLELKRAQQEIVFSEKLASVGRLTAGIAHEIGNPIGIVLGYLELLQREDLGEDERLELLHRMTNEIQRINQIIRQLLDFSRPSSTDLQTISINPLIQETLAVLAHQFRQQEIEVLLDLSAQPDTVLANADQLKQVFLNLMVNAGDAMAVTSDRSQGGRLRLSSRWLSEEILEKEHGGEQPLRRRTDPQAANFRHLRRTYGTPGKPWIGIQFADTGVGIAREDQERIFDPFFTTKEVGKGTGLGLSVSIQIIETLGGRMEVSSRPGEGTVVSVLLPFFDGEAG
jgi:two-component system NtrC family sensor kinase